MAKEEADRKNTISEEKTEARDYELVEEGGEEIMRINAIKWPYSPSVEDSSAVMGFAIDRLVNVPQVSRIVFKQRRNYAYDYEQTQMLVEIAQLYDHVVRQKKVFGPNALGGLDPRFLQLRANAVNYIVFNLLRTDPIGAYVELKRLIREEKIHLKGDIDSKVVESRQIYLGNLMYLFTLLGQTSLIKKVEDNLDGSSIGDRSLYKEVFRPVITPDFMYTRLMAETPIDGEQIDFYTVGEAEINLYKVPGDIKTLYHVNPPEFKLSEDEYALLDLAKQVLAEHKPREEEFLDPSKMRRTFFNIGRDLITELAETKGINLPYAKIHALASILVRYTVGFGLIEILLQDPKIQDITINGPVGASPMFVMHQDYDECATNIIPSVEDAESWASKFRLISGRPLDEANPVLDTELSIPGARARVAVMTKPLSPTGLAYALRRHRDNPWTLPLFIQNGMINPLGAGLMSFMIDGARTILVAGTRSSGKTSFLGSILVEIMRRYRVITVEDSVTGDSTLLIERNGKLERISIGGLVDSSIEKYGCWYNLTDHEITGNPESIKVYSMNKDGKIVLSKVSKLIRHKVNKPIFEITTRTGRKIKVTGDHSLFTLGKDAEIVEIKTNELKVGNHIAVPRVLPNLNCDKDFISVFELVLNLKNSFFKGKPIEKLLVENKLKVKQMGYECDYSKSAINNWFKKGILPAKILKDLISLGQVINLEGLKFKVSSNSLVYLPVKIELTDDLLTLAGLWLADGCYDKRSTILSVIDKDERKIVMQVAKRYGLPVKMHSDGVSLMINSLTFKILLREILELKGNAYTKRMPLWVFNLSKEQVAKVLCGLFSGEGCISDKEIAIALSSRNLLEDTQTLLSQFGILLRIGKLREKDKTYNSRISALESLKTFKFNINFLQSYKKKRLNKHCLKTSTHDSSDIIPLSLNAKEKLSNLILGFNNHDYITRENHIGKKKLSSMLLHLELENPLIKNLKILTESDLFFDQVKEINKINDFSGYVYDLSVPGCENFVCENVLAHNTLELPVKSLRDIGYNIQQMKVRSALMAGGGELAADEGIRTSLRLGDSSLIVGEVRSSIRGDEEVVIIRNGTMERIQIKDLENCNLDKVYVPTVDNNLRVKLSKLTGFVKHPKRKKLLKIKTKTGREVTVTHDHSLFAPTKNFEIAPIECKDLKLGDQIVIPSCMPCGFNNVEHINVFDYLPEFRVQNFESSIRSAIKNLGWKKATEICNIQSGDVYNYLRVNQKTNIPFSSFNNLMTAANLDCDFNTLKVCKGTSLALPATIPINADFCRFLGYYVSEGYYSLKDNMGGNVVITNSVPEIVEDLSKISESLFNLKINSRKVRSLGNSIQHRLSCLPLAKLISKLGCGRTCYEKRVPPIIFGLSKKKIASFLSGLYSGDGSFTSSESSGNSVRYSSTSKKLAEDVSYLLLNFGIVARITEKEPSGIGKHKQWILEFKDRRMVQTFFNEIGFVGKDKIPRFKKWAHTAANNIRFDKIALKEHLVKYTRKYRHLFRFLKCSKNYLEKVVSDPECEVSDKLKTFALGDFFLDEIKRIEEVNLEEPEYVYDLSVEPTQNFIGGFGGIMLHNTEAKALYEAMRVGALANVVAGTIHGASPYGVYDRVVNDLEVPKTSFKATDLIVVANPIKTPDGLHRRKRITQITEVRKHWTDDPLAENGFVDLMKYNPEKDTLEPTDELINGESETLKAVATNVKEWAGNWDSIWENVLLRAKLKEMLVNYSDKSNNRKILEAPFVVASNDAFHRISDDVRIEVGALDSKMIASRWEDWIKNELKKK